MHPIVLVGVGGFIGAILRYLMSGLMGFGANSRIHTSRILRLSLDLPIVVEIVDTPENIKAFLACIENVVTEGLVTLEKAAVHIYRGRPQDGE
jgi:PII-like signaling protein